MGRAQRNPSMPVRVAMGIAQRSPSYNTEHGFAFSRLNKPELASMLSLNEEAGKTGCALHPRSRVQLRTEESAHEHTGAAGAFRHSVARQTKWRRAQGARKGPNAGLNVSLTSAETP